MSDLESNEKIIIHLNDDQDKDEQLKAWTEYYYGVSSEEDEFGDNTDWDDSQDGYWQGDSLVFIPSIIREISESEEKVLSEFFPTVRCKEQS